MMDRTAITRRSFSMLAGAAALAPFAPRAYAQQVPEFWNYLGAGGELEAVEGLLAVANAQHPDTPVKNRIVPGSSDGLRQQLQVSLMGGTPPVVSQSNTGYELRLNAQSGRLLPINDVWDSVNGGKVFSEGLRRIVSVGKDNYAIPLSMSILGNCFYNKAIFDKLSLKVPKGWDEFSEVCAKIKAAGITPLGAHSPASFLFYQTYGSFLSTVGVDGFWAFTRGDIPFTSPEMRQVFKLFKEKIASNFSKTWSGSKWADSVDQMMRGEVAMCIIGDWASGYMVQRGWKPEVDYDFFASPGLEKYAIFQTDVVVGYKGTQEKTAINFLKSVASPEGQAAFNRKKGSLAANSLTPTDFYNAVGKREFEKLTSPDFVALPNPYLLLPTGFHLDVSTTVERYAATLDDKAFDDGLAVLEGKRKTLKDTGKFIVW